MGANLIERLRETLSRVQELAGEDFSGIGIIVCTSSENLPIFPLRPKGPPLEDDLVSLLAMISSFKNEFHDGFHLISPEWKLVKASQYFSPPIILDAKVDRTKRFGGRYLAALFGSVLPGVQATGVASNGFGLAIFQHGREICYERTA